VPDFPFKPNRWPEQAAQEEELWAAIKSAWQPIEQRVWELTGLTQPRSRRDLGDPGTWDTQHWDLLDDAAREFERELIGDVRGAAQYADSINEDAVLSGAGRTGFATGIDRARALTQAEEMALPMRGELAIRPFLQDGFARLSDQGRLRLTGILRNAEYPGGSVQSILQEAMATGENPIATARTLAGRFDQYERWEFARLARTEVSFAQNAGMEAEWEAEGFVRPFDPVAGQWFDSPPFHPNCICSIVPDPQTGLLVYDVAVTACPICQERLAAQLTAVTHEPHEPREPVTGEAAEKADVEEAVLTD